MTTTTRRKKRGPYFKRRKRAMRFRILDSGSYVSGSVSEALSSLLGWQPDPRELASEYVDRLAGKRDENGRKLPRDTRIKLAAERYGLKEEAFRNWKNRSKKQRRHGNLSAKFQSNEQEFVDD